jgi:hypothetical protein
MLSPLFLFLFNKKNKNVVESDGSEKISEEHQIGDSGS